MLLQFSLSSLSILITSVLNSASDRLFIYILFSSFSGVWSVLSFGPCFFISSFWQPPCVCFYVLERAAMRSFQKVSSHVLWKIETFIEEDTRYKKHCTKDKDASVPFKVGTLGPYTVLPITISCPIIFPWISLMVWNLFLFKCDFRLGKSQKSQGTKSGLEGLSHLGCQSLLIAACICSTLSGVLLVAGLPDHGSLSTDSQPSLKYLCHTFICAAFTALSLEAFWIIWIVSAEECWSSMQNLMQIRCSTHSVILNSTATQDTCSLSGVYCPHWLVQWSCHCLCMCIPVHSPWLPGYINVAQTVLVILTMARLFSDRPYMTPCLGSVA